MLNCSHMACSFFCLGFSAMLLSWIFGHVKKLTNFPLFLKSKIMNTTGPLLLYFLVIVSLTLHTILCLSSDDQTNVDDVLSPFSTEEEANSFLVSRSRKKRTLWEECYGEGCTFWEAAYYYGNWDSTREYLYDMACNKWPCETGCRCDRAHPGYRDSGPHWRVCNDINECRSNKGGCREDQYCVNAICGYSCPACTAIANCERLICTTASNHQCNRCNFDRGGQVKAYQQVSSGGYPNRVCEQRCSWRPDSQFCYPGSCPGTPSTCTCASGFGGHNCLRISSQPTIMHCLAKLQRIVGGAERDTLEADCGAVTASSTVYVGRHIAYNRLQMTWDSSWIGPTAADWPRPYYINDFRVGIVTASSTWRLLRGGSALRSGTITCDIGHNRDDPDTNLHDCVDHGDLSLPTLQHGDKLEFKARATNGGYVIINNHDRSNGVVTQNARQYYQGSEVIHTAHFTYDLRDPVHCSVASSCSSKIMEIGPPYTKNGQIQLRWPGWSDEGSGLGRYEYMVYKLQPYGDVLGMRSVTPVMSGSQNVSGGAGMVDVTLSEPGTYCFLLTVDDVAGNYQRARRFLIYDDVNNVTVDAHQPLWADSAAVNTSHLWQTNLQNSLGTGTKISLKWPGRYRNLFHHQHKLLAAIEPYDPPIAAGYEEVTGLPPLQRSRQAIPNTFGIMKVETVFAVDHAGGRTITSPPGTWTSVPDVTAQGVDLDIPRVDGDSVRLWLRAFDIVDNFVQEEVLLHVDSSPPVVQNFWLNRHGVPALAVHHSSDLFTMRFEFEAFDDHSGLHNIHWSLQDFLNSSTVHGEGQVAVRRPSVLHPECDPPHCACIPKDSECYFRNYEIVPDLSKMDIPVGSHDHDYVFVITVTNNAMLVTTVTFQITVDESPPTAGHVQDALSGQRDLDFQQDLQLHAWWDGFFDRESGVQFYQYRFANRCLGQDEFGIPQSQQLHNTTGKFGSWTAPVPGTYFCTVVAYNPALTPSQPVCSDGITVDASPPSVRHVKLSGYHARPGLVSDDGGNVWIVNKDGEREVVDDPPASCRNASRRVEDVDLWPIAEPPYKRNTTSQNCTELGPLPDIGYLPIENHLHVQWEGWDDESGIADYEVGLSSTESGAASPDIHPYTSSKSHPELTLYHPNLAQGALFYIVIRATNRALLSTSKVFGPVTVDVTPPVIDTPINVTHTTSGNDDFLVATWSEGSIYDTEDLEDLALEVAAGHSSGGTELFAFAPVTSFLESNSLCPTASCVALPVRQFEWHLHGDQVYYVTLRVTDSAGLTSSLTSTPYHHNVELPSVGVVFELAESAATDTLRNPPDIDHQTSQTEIRCRWFGFAHAYQDISYLAGVGSAAGLDDVVTVEVMGSATSHVFAGLSLQHFQRYYVTVVARSEAGEVNSTSDGVAVLPQDGELVGATVSDGACHTPILYNETLLTHHASAAFPASCADDIDFQASTTTVHSFWSVPASMRDFVSYVRWTLEREQSVGSTTWEAVRTIQKAPNTGFLVATELHLSPGGHYRSALQFCHQDGCFRPTVSDGFWVTAEPPVPTEINSLIYNDANMSLAFSWNEFGTTELVGNEALQTMAMSGYEWTLSVTGKESSALGTILYPWQPVADLRRLGQNISATVALPNPLEFTTCIKLLLRGKNKAGLYSVTSREIHDCNDPGSVNIRDPVVFDAVPDFNATLEENSGISLSTNHFWTVPDEDFTRSRDTLAAAWPSLRHGDYYWKVLSADSIERWSYHRHENGINYHSFRSDEPETLRCGQTKLNFVNVRGLDLQNGQRYFVCVFAEETTLEFEMFEQVAPEVSVCSNGVVVDTEPPVPGEVHAGWGNQNYQTSTTVLPIVWESFRDVEVHGNTGHQHSGVVKYEYAIGTSPGVMDVRQFVDVGLTNHVVARDLLLQSGHTYYVTVRATDHVGLQATATSAGLTIDTTPPSVTNSRIDVGGRYLMSTDVVSVNWDGLFFDLESGVREYAWCIGSQPGHDDVMAYDDVGPEEQASSDPSSSLGLLEGHIYFVTIKATNRAGLAATASSWGLVVEASPPLPGFVHDGGQQDRDYQHNLSTISVTWGGFREPHTDIAGYSWMVGTCSGCDDVMEEQHVGLMTEASATDLNLQPGVKYIVTVTACNTADLCTTVSSDGVVPDTSPPLAGLVLDGNSDGDIQYQASRTTIRAHWFNFHDPHTGLSHYEWRVGTSAGAEDILPSTRLHLSEQAFASGIDPPLPLGVPLFVTIRAYNKAGLWVERSSNGFTVDNTAPLPVTNPTVDSTHSSIVPNTQVWRDTLQATWDFADQESPLLYHVVSLYTHHQSDLVTEPVRLPGDADSHAFSNLTLHDGDTYYVKATACNAAMLCTTRESPGHMVDSSPPTVGTFAVATDHVTALGRDVDGHMTYWQTIGSTGPHLRLAWLGFADPHSGIDHYLVTVGTFYSGTDLTQDGHVRVNHTGSFESSGEGHVQLGTVPVSRDLVPGERIYISLWAVNMVGLNGDVAHATFETVPSNPTSGVLDLVRRCEAQSCQGHCTCAPSNQKCQPLNTGCNEVTGNSQYTSVEVIDTLDLHTSSPHGQDFNFTRSSTSLAATWGAEQASRIPVQRYEWSAGLAGEVAGSHVFDTSTDRIWHDVGSRTSAVLTLRREGTYASLEPRVTYVWYVKAWYSQNDFAIFTSDGVKSLPLPPQVSSSRKVKDLENISTNKDKDFTTSQTMFAVSWNSVFPDPFGEINNYQVALGTSSGASDVIAWGIVTTTPDVTRTSLDNLSLQTGVTYYSSVRATNHAGLHTTVTSDGIKVDTIAPTAGTVYDGLGLHDADYQNDSLTVWATWHGFSDLESYIHHYVWCVGSSPGAEDILPCRDVGVQISASEKVTQALTSGTKYYSTVTAVDAAGLRSSPVLSNGITVDSTPPVPVEKLNFGPNLVHNPSFEQALGVVWNVSGTAEAVAASGFATKDGQKYLHLHGSILQKVPTQPGQKYQLIFHARHVEKLSLPLQSQEGKVSAPGLHKTFKLYQRFGTFDGSGSIDEAAQNWHQHIYYFTATGSESEITFGSVGRAGMALDQVSVRLVNVSAQRESDGESVSGLVHVHTSTAADWHVVQASWGMEDLESPIVKYEWAIGTVKGGTQLQGFKSVGRTTSGRNENLHLQHGSSIHVTVVATNAAELRTVGYSEPAVVDLTPPVISNIQDGVERDDVDYQSTETFAASWEVTDKESGVSWCEWGQGLSPGSTEISHFQPTDSFSSTSKNLTGLIHHGQTVYTTVRCHNHAGLESQAVTDGVTLVTSPPDSTAAELRVASPSQTPFPAEDRYQSAPEQLRFFWEGFSDEAGIDHYEISISGPNNYTHTWLSAGGNGETSATLSGLGLESHQTYSVFCRAVNMGGLVSNAVWTNVTIETEQPLVNGSSVVSQWQPPDILHLDWTGNFLSQSALVYEVSLGTVRGGSDVMQWMETTETAMTVTGVDHSRAHYVIITAVNRAGLYVSQVHRLAV
ncbi:uncharacterized protein LOC144860568 isoform X2 [Branchiostoma floridae x Branchiostoma japonicum]